MYFQTNNTLQRRVMNRKNIVLIFDFPFDCFQRNDGPEEDFTDMYREEAI